MSGRDRKFTIALSVEDYEKLTHIASAAMLSRGHVVREGIVLRYMCSHLQHPICADGHSCLCPKARIYLDENEDSCKEGCDKKQMDLEEAEGAAP